MVSLASLVVRNVDSVPIPLSLSGGLALVANFIDCPLSCSSCPWEANVCPRSAKVVSWSTRLSNIIKGVNPDVLVLIGAEPYRSILAYALSYEAKKLAIPVAIKVLGRYLTALQHSELIGLVDLLLIEIRGPADITLHNIEKRFEVLLVADSVEEASKILENLTFPRNTPIAIVVNEGNVHRLTKFLDRARSRYPLASIPLSHSAELASVYCPACGAPLVARASGIAIRSPRIIGGRCMVCGYPIGGIRSSRITKVPVLEPLI